MKTSLLTVLDAGDDEALALLGVILDPLLVVISNVGQSKDVVNTLGVIPHAPISREVADLIDGDGYGGFSEGERGYKKR